MSDKPNTLTSSEKSNGWILLFDGETTNGWHSYNKNSVSKNWQVVDGALEMDPKLKSNGNSGDLVTNKK